MLKEILLQAWDAAPQSDTQLPHHAGHRLGHRSRDFAALFTAQASVR